MSISESHSGVVTRLYGQLLAQLGAVGGSGVAGAGLGLEVRGELSEGFAQGAQGVGGQGAERGDPEDGAFIRTRRSMAARGPRKTARRFSLAGRRVQQAGLAGEEGFPGFLLKCERLPAAADEEGRNRRDGSGHEPHP